LKATDQEKPRSCGDAGSLVIGIESISMPITSREGPPSKWSEGYFRFLCPGCGECGPR
jgi:hypothetical protein